MKAPLTVCSLLGALALIAIAGEPEQKSEAITFRPESAGMPKTLRCAMAWGDLHVRGTDRSEVRVTVTYPSVEVPPASRRIPGRLRPLGEGTDTAYRLLEQGDTLVLLGGGRHQWVARLELEVPRDMALALQARSGGDIAVENLTADVDVATQMAGRIALRNVQGAITAAVADGELDLVCPGPPVRPVALSSSGGAITIALPHGAAANLKLRAFNGAIYTDLEESALRMTPVATPAASRDPRATAIATTRRFGGNTVPPGECKSVLGGQVFSGALHGGGNEISAATISGTIIIRRARQD